MRSNPTAVLFDIDGTLVDSNFLHVDAWSAAFTDLGLSVSAWRIQRAIGADGAELLAQLVGDESEEVKLRASDLQSEHYRRLQPRLRLLPGAQALVRAIGHRGPRVVLATSAPEEELEVLLELLDLHDVVHAVTSSENVETAKPAPDIIAVALEKAGVDASDAVMVGDAIWDVQAASKVGVPTVALRSGGSGRAELTDAGAIAVYEDARELHDRVDASPLARLWA